jgi:hypothetical protein
MAVVLVHQGPSLTQDKYDEIVRRLSGGEGMTCQAFGAVLGPILAEVGVTDPPAISPAHNFVSS